jgi:4-carboxymuconolactone decarboxylase
MADDDRYERGMAKFNEVYCGDVPAPPKGASDFFDLMIENLFAEVWTRPALSQRDRRLLLLGAIAAQGEPTTFAIQVKAAIKNGELEPDQVREVLIHLTQYIGYPKVASMLGPTEQTIAALAKEEAR